MRVFLHSSSIVEILSQFDVPAMEKLKHKSYFRKIDLLLRKHKVIFNAIVERIHEICWDPPPFAIYPEP